MATGADKKSNHVSNLIQEIAAFMDAAAALQRRYNEALALGYTDTSTGLQDGDFLGTNGYLTAAQYRSAMTQLTALNAAFTTGSPMPFAVLLQMLP